ncbi:hypothetical protein ACWGQ5_39425 [Streptomyces sp. NPDC055722]
MDGREELFFHTHALFESAELDPEVANAWTVVRCIDYWLWGLDSGFTEDPLRCAAIVDAFTRHS